MLVFARDHSIKAALVYRSDRVTPVPGTTATDGAAGVFDRNPVGRLVTRLTTDVDVLTDLLGWPVAQQCFKRAAAVDCGDVVNMDSATAQVEGGIIYALSAALHSEITIAQGRVAQRNFRDYQMIHLVDAPRVKVEFVRSDAALGGLGEPAVPPLAPALTNAVFAACGVRVRELPLKKTPLTRKA